jgi:D-hexose-6-phosphate mutarotase
VQTTHNNTVRICVPALLPQVYLFGGAVCSWKQASGDEVLYVRPDAVFDKSKPISGGADWCCCTSCLD